MENQLEETLCDSACTAVSMTQIWGENPDPLEKIRGKQSCGVGAEAHQSIAFWKQPAPTFFNRNCSF